MNWNRTYIRSDAWRSGSRYRRLFLFNANVLKNMKDQRALNEQEHFDKLAQETGEIWWGSTTPAGLLRKERRADLILKALSPYPNPLVLELGCGTGALTRFLLQKSPNMRLVGLDISPVSVKEAIKRFHTYLHAD